MIWISDLAASLIGPAGYQYGAIRSCEANSPRQAHRMVDQRHGNRLQLIYGQGNDGTDSRARDHIAEVVLTDVDPRDADQDGNHQRDDAETPPRQAKCDRHRESECRVIARERWIGRWLEQEDNMVRLEWARPVPDPDDALIDRESQRGRDRGGDAAPLPMISLSSSARPKPCYEDHQH